MTVEADIFTALRGLTDDRVFPDVVDLGTARPYITYQQIGGEALSYVDDTLPNAKHGRFQIEVWADTRLQATAIALQIEALLVVCTAFQARPIGAHASKHEPDVHQFGTLQDFSIHSPR